MQFDDGSSDVHPGEDITITAQGHTEDLGAATYDSDHDGVADSVIVSDGDHVLVFTDHNHDGHADSVTEYDSSGHQVNPDGSDSSGTSSDNGGTTGTETSSHTGGTDTTGTDTTGHTTGTQTGGDTTGTDTTGTAGTSGSDTAAGSITVTADDGSHVGVGAPTVDLNQDGHPDTAIVKHADGSVTGYTDRDGDGQADQITQISSDGSVIITTHDGSGEWHVAATGHVDSSGKLVEDSTPSTTSTESVPNTIHAGDGTSTGTTPAGSTTGTDTGNPTGNTTGTDTGHPTGNTTGTDTGNTTDTHSTGDGGTTTPTHGNGDITFSADGKEYDLGKPTADMNGDGTPDTVVSHQADGTVIGYTDTNGDGSADQVTEIAPDGHVTIGASDGHGGWHQVATGHLDPNGKFVPDGDSTGTSGSTQTQPAATGS